MLHILYSKFHYIAVVIIFWWLGMISMCNRCVFDAAFKEIMADTISNAGGASKYLKGAAHTHGMSRAYDATCGGIREIVFKDWS